MEREQLERYLSQKEEIRELRYKLEHLGEGDSLLSVSPVEETDTMVMQSEKNMFLRIAVSEIPQKKKAALGVRGMKLAAKDTLTDVFVIGENEEKIVKIKDKDIYLNRLHVGSRDTKGVKK